MNFFNINNLVKLALLLLMFVSPVYAETASMEFGLSVPSYLEIDTISGAVLTANITDKTGNLQAPLYSKFRVTTNSAKPKTLYIKANALTSSGNEEAMFEYNGRVYVAFTNVANKPKHQSLVNCKMGIHPKSSPGVVAYPVESIVGVRSKYLLGKNRYEVQVENGTTDITVNIGSKVLQDSFSTNDPKGFYQAVLSLTETDI